MPSGRSPILARVVSGRFTCDCCEAAAYEKMMLGSGRLSMCTSSPSRAIPRKNLYLGVRFVSFLNKTHLFVSAMLQNAKKEISINRNAAIQHTSSMMQYQEKLENAEKDVSLIKNHMRQCAEKEDFETIV